MKIFGFDLDVHFDENGIHFDSKGGITKEAVKFVKKKTSTAFNEMIGYQDEPVRTSSGVSSSRKQVSPRRQRRERRK